MFNVRKVESGDTFRFQSNFTVGRILTPHAERDDLVEN
jgi:hypothetical protein